MVGKPVFEEGSVFKDRLFLAQQCLGETLAGPVNWREYHRGADPEVRLPVFVRWAVSIHWKIPAELLELPALGEAIEPSVADQAVYKTGLSGRPTSWQLIETECRRRFGTGERHPTRAGWARVLNEWLRTEHPDAPILGVKTLTNKLPGLFRELEAGKSNSH